MLILASGSPRRRELLELTGRPYQCIPSEAEEGVPEGTEPQDVPEFLAVKKAEAVLETHPQDIVIGADTIVELDGQILGKPSTPEEAVQMLRQLSGNTHMVYTGVAILSAERREHFTTVTKVEFYNLTEEEIQAYVATGEPMDKAGGYGIQGKGALVVKRIHGDFYTVMGLPIGEVERHLRRFDPEKS